MMKLILNIIMVIGNNKIDVYTGMWYPDLHTTIYVVQT